MILSHCKYDALTVSTGTQSIKIDVSAKENDYTVFTI